MRTRRGWKKADDGGMELVNPSPAFLPVFVHRGSQPKKTNIETEGGETKLHLQADAEW